MIAIKVFFLKLAQLLNADILENQIFKKGNTQFMYSSYIKRLLFSHIPFNKTLFKYALLNSTVSLSHIWLIDEMNQGNGYYSSPDPYLGNLMAPKIEKILGLIWRKLRLKYEI